jgi:hypothetical protein
MTTSYIVGAGASKAVWRFPVLGGLLADKRADIANSRRLHSYVSERFGDDLGIVNLEDVLADLDNTLYGLGNTWFGATSHPIHRSALDRKSDLMKVLVRVFALSSSGDHSRQIADYASVFGDRVSDGRVITLNYDLGIEEYLKNKGQYYESSEQNNENVLNAHLGGGLVSLENGLQNCSVNETLLKLHGSLNYWACCNPSCRNRHHIWRGRCGKYCCSTCGADTERIIVPPSMNKTFDRYPSLALAWRLAQESLRASERIVVWGYSCPPTDHHFAWVLRSCGAGWRLDDEVIREVIVINPEKRVKRRLEALLDPNVELRKRGSLLFRQFDDHTEFAKAQRRPAQARVN